MKYRTKLHLSLSGTAAITSLFGFGILLQGLQKHIFYDQQIKAITVAATTAALIDAELIKQIKTPEDEHSITYAEIKKELINVRDANRREDIQVCFLYTLKPDPNNTAQFIYLVDAEEDPSWVSHMGDKVASISATQLVRHLKEDYSPKKFVVDWGKWTTGYAPIHDKAGYYVATVGVDIAASRFVEILTKTTQLFIAAVLASLLFAFIGGHWLAKQISSSLNTLLLCVREIGKGDLYCSASLKTEDEFEKLSKEIDHMTLGLRERERLKLNFSRYVSQQVVEKILKVEDIEKLANERRKITVLFSDIRQFTKLAESLPPERVVSLLNEYFGKMLEVIFHHQGILDKFLGDGMMVEFGTPFDDKLQERHAVMTAIGMQREVRKLTEKWKSEGKPEIKIGIGVHTGFAVVGNIGSKQRIGYTAVGDTVNVAAHLEQTTKLLKKPILVSESTYEAIKNEFKATLLGPMILPGRKEPVTIYSIEFE